MFRYISLKNFRAYRNQRFEFSKINIFMGPNNSGKSSALSALNLIAQSFKNRRVATSPLELNGVYEDLGTYIDAVYNNIPRSKIGFDFGFDRSDVSLEFKYRSQRREIDITKFSLQNGKKPIYSYTSTTDSFDSKIGSRNHKSFSQKTVARPRFFSFWPTPRNLMWESSLADTEREYIRDHLNSLSIAEMRLNDSFRHYDALSPFRARPERTYLYSGESPDSIGRIGSNGVNMLVSDFSKRGRLQKGISNEINRWFQVTGIAQEIRVKNLTPRHFELCIVDFSGKEHNICDVGFGCSQVLPVLVGGLNLLLDGGDTPARRRMIDKTYVVQEPEIHLHPNAQAALGSFFVSLCRLGGQIFLETHSDHLVLRIARHIARGDISPDDVKLYYVHDSQGEKEVTKIGFNERGAFDPAWPGGFLPQRQNETLALARERVRGGATDTQQQLNFVYA